MGCVSLLYGSEHVTETKPMEHSETKVVRLPDTTTGSGGVSSLRFRDSAPDRSD